MPPTLPDASHPHPGVPASLPAVPAGLPSIAGLPQQAAAPAASVPIHQAPADPAADTLMATELAKQLVSQYQQDPFKLAGSIAQLKGEYVSRHFHLVPNPVGD